jgi:hypothetical protein
MTERRRVFLLDGGPQYGKIFIQQIGGNQHGYETADNLART